MNNDLGMHGEVGQCRLLYKSLIDRHTVAPVTNIGLIFDMYCMSEPHHL